MELILQIDGFVDALKGYPGILAMLGLVFLYHRRDKERDARREAQEQKIHEQYQAQIRSLAEAFAERAKECHAVQRENADVLNKLIEAVSKSRKDV